jgi:WhiB family redox-sensing transcriptional regulator
MAHNPQVWRRQAACRGRADDVFFPDSALPDYAARVAEAKATCATCPVRQACLEIGMRERYGIWGGLTARQRRAEHDRRRSEAA